MNKLTKKIPILIVCAVFSFTGIQAMASKPGGKPNSPTSVKTNSVKRMLQRAGEKAKRYKSKASGAINSSGNVVKMSYSATVKVLNQINSQVSLKIKDMLASPKSYDIVGKEGTLYLAVASAKQLSVKAKELLVSNNSLIKALSIYNMKEKDLVDCK